MNLKAALSCPFSKSPVLAQAKSWLLDSENASARWLGKYCVIAAWLGLFLATVTPPHGTSFSVCWFKNCTGLPCPGCGLTRSLSCGLRGMFVESWQYHPMGLLILTMLLAIAFASVLPPRLRERLSNYMESRAYAFNLLYLAFVVAFLAFGVGRALLNLISILPGHV
jgi:hypothetical protein